MVMSTTTTNLTHLATLSNPEWGDFQRAIYRHRIGGSYSYATIRDGEQVGGRWTIPEGWDGAEKMIAELKAEGATLVTH